MNEHEITLTPIKCIHTIRDPTPEEGPIAGNNQMLDVRIDFHFWNGSKWIEYGCGQALIQTRAVMENLEIHKKTMEQGCWRWFSNMLKKGEIEHGEPGNKITSKILAVARYPIYFKEESL